MEALSDIASLALAASKNIGWVIAVAGALWYVTRARRSEAQNTYIAERLLAAAALAAVLIALLLTYAQYAMWKLDPLGAKLLPPFQSLGYFAKYAGTHYWLSPILALLVGAAFYGILRMLAERNPRFFESGEIELGALAALAAGWPRVIVFLAALAAATVVISIVRTILKKGLYTMLGIPFLIGLAVALVWGAPILDALGWGMLTVVSAPR